MTGYPRQNVAEGEEEATIYRITNIVGLISYQGNQQLGRVPHHPSG